MSIWDSIAAPLIAIVNKVVPDKAAAAAITGQMQVAAQAGELEQEFAQLASVTTAQSDIDKVEAASTNWWVAGWRPYIGWICGTGLAMSAIIGPLFTWITMLFGHPIAFPIANDPLLQSTLAGLLGMGHISRTVEKMKGVAR